MGNRKQNEQLRRARQQKDWTQKRAAAEIGVTRETYLRWENGQKYPRSGMLELVCKTFGLSAEALGFTEDYLRSGALANQDEQVALTHRNYKFRLYPNKEAVQQLQWVLDHCRELYNAGLSERKDAWNYARKSISYYDQTRDLAEIKQIRPEYKEIASNVLYNVLHRLDLAFQGFFRRVKNGERAGFPRFKGRNQYDSFGYSSMVSWKLEGDHLQLTKIGTIKIKLHRPIEGTIKTLTIKREADQWYVWFVSAFVQF